MLRKLINIYIQTLYVIYTFISIDNDKCITTKKLQIYIYIYIYIYIFIYTFIYIIYTILSYIL